MLFRSLAVTNLSGTLAAGDSFTLFQSSSINSSFAAYALPSLASGLGWNTSSLTNGVLSVVQTVNPTPTNLTVTVAGGTLTLACQDSPGDSCRRRPRDQK